LIRRALTLLETIIAVSILSVICLGLTQAVLVSLQASEEAARKTDIINGAIKVLERLLQADYETILESDGRRFQLTANGYILGEGVVHVSGDLDGDGLVTSGPPRFEDPQLAVRVAVFFKGKKVVERIVTRIGGLLR